MAPLGLYGELCDGLSYTRYEDDEQLTYNHLRPVDFSSPAR